MAMFTGWIRNDLKLGAVTGITGFFQLAFFELFGLLLYLL